MDIAIRRLLPGDEAIATTAAARFKSVTPDAEWMARFLANSANHLIVASSGAEPVGLLLAYRIDRLDRPATQLFIYEVAVVPAWRRRGVGSRMIAFVRDLVRGQGWVEAFVITSRENVAARNLYQKTGGQIEEASGMVFVYPGADS
jgi:ribosomal protein S18 acetylase RimI-like enzyme